jgi:hypothetical protein
MKKEYYSVFLARYRMILMSLEFRLCQAPYIHSQNTLFFCVECVQVYVLFSFPGSVNWGTHFLVVFTGDTCACRMSLSIFCMWVGFCSYIVTFLHTFLPICKFQFVRRLVERQNQPCHLRGENIACCCCCCCCCLTCNLFMIWTDLSQLSLLVKTYKIHCVLPQSGQVAGMIVVRTFLISIMFRTLLRNTHWAFCPDVYILRLCIVSGTRWQNQYSD